MSGGINIPLGQLGSQLYVRKLSGVFTTGYHLADPDAQWTSGVVAKLALDTNGNTVATPVTAVTDTPFAMFWCDKTVSFYNPVYKETVDLATSAGVAVGAGVSVNLAHVNLDAASVKVTLADGTTPCVLNTDYTIDTIHGTIAPKNGGNLVSVLSALISYRYQDPNKSGLDQTAGSGKAALYEGYGEIGTLIYDTSVAYTLGAGVYFTATGLPTTASGGSAVKFGSVIKVPTNADPELQIKVTL